MEYRENPLKNIKTEGRLFVLTALLSAADLEGTVSDLRPKNLVYDIYGRVTLKASNEEELQSEDGVDKASNISGESFVKQYKALCGHLLQDKYKYSDYYEGGMSLLEKDSFLKNINESETIEEVKTALLGEYQKIYREDKEKKSLVGKKKYFAIRLALAMISVLLCGACVYILFNYFRETRIDKAMIASHEAYLNKDYPKCINAMSNIKMKDIDEDTKKVLAISTVKTDNLTQEQKDNITLDISSSDTAVLYDYWVYISRNSFEEAETTAKQLSDDELLLYAYMKEAVYLKNNTTMEGESKAARLSTVENEIERLSKVYKEAEENKENETEESE